MGSMARAERIQTSTQKATRNVDHSGRVGKQATYRNAPGSGRNNQGGKLPQAGKKSGFLMLGTSKEVSAGKKDGGPRSLSSLRRDSGLGVRGIKPGRTRSRLVVVEGK